MGEGGGGANTLLNKLTAMLVFRSNTVLSVGAKQQYR